MTLLSTRGYEATSPADVQRTAGVGQGSFYHHFPSKAELGSAALSALADEMCAEFDQLTSGSAQIALEGYLGLKRNALAGCRIGRISMESSLTDERIRQPVGRYFDHVRDRLVQLFSQLDLAVPADALADLALATVQGAYVTARATGDPATMRNATTALLDLIALASSTTNEETP